MAISRRQFIREASTAMIAGSLFGSSGCFGGGAHGGSTRALSLRVLQEKLKSGRMMAGERSTIQNLVGITRLRGFAIDYESNDIVLFGSVDRSWPALRLEDLMVALRNAFHRYTEDIDGTTYYSYPGCSIDPDPVAMAQLENVSSQVVELVTRWAYG